MTDPTDETRPDREALETALARDLTERGFMGWLLTSGDNPIWIDRTPEQEIARVATTAVLALIPAPHPEGAETLRAGVKRLCDTADEFVAEMRTVALHPEASAVLIAFVTLVNRSRALLAAAPAPTGAVRDQLSEAGDIAYAGLLDTLGLAAADHQTEAGDE